MQLPASILARREASRAKRHGFDLNRKIPGTSFTYGEVVHRSGATALPTRAFKLPNGKKVTPYKNTIIQARNLQRLRNKINAERKRRGLKPTGMNLNSWWRTWKHNGEVGGARDSQHLYLLASDITHQETVRLTPWDYGATFNDMAGEVYSKGGFGEYPSGARHVDSRGWRARWTTWAR